MRRRRRDPSTILKEILDKIDEESGKALKNDLKAGVFGGNEDQFRRWVVKFCIDKNQLIREEREGKITVYVKTEHGENWHRLLCEDERFRTNRVIYALSGRKLRFL